MPSIRKVSAGDKLRIPASAYNAFVDATQPGFRSRVDREFHLPDYGVIDVRNESGAARKQGDCFVIQGGVFDPAEGGSQTVDAFRWHQIYRIDTCAVGPIAGSSVSNYCWSRWCVLLEPVANLGVAKACISGVCCARLDVRDYRHRYANIEPNKFYATTDWGGYARILVTETGVAGIQYALIHMASPGGLRQRGTLRYGITAGAGNAIVDLRQGGSRTEVRYDWMTGGEGISAGKEVAIRYWETEGFWAIDGAECE